MASTPKSAARRENGISLVQSCAAMDLDREVAEIAHVLQAPLVALDRLGLVGNQRDDGAVMARSQAPDMQVGDTVVADLETAPDRLGEGTVGRGVEQHGARVAYQGP